jgi:1-acyl-sn-glycerol-3-phosphate acyltransferase
MIFLRSLAFNLFHFGSTTLVMIPGAVIHYLMPERALGLAILWARVQIAAARVICGIRFHVTGLEHLPRSGPALIASRHESAFDTLIWLTLVPRVSYVVKTELTRIPIFGGLLRSTGMIPVDRAGGATAMRELMHAGLRAARAERQIVIFPEGTRGEPGQLLPLQPGVAALAASTHLPVIPVVTDSGRCWGRRAFHKYPGTIRIHLLPPLPAGLKRPELMARLETVLREGMARLAKENPP